MPHHAKPNPVVAPKATLWLAPTHTDRKFAALMESLDASDLGALVAPSQA